MDITFLPPFSLSLYYKLIYMEQTTDHNSCNILVDILVANGVKQVVISPGSRNAPLIMAFARKQEISKYVVVDERSAAFMALGMAQQTQCPVALICTSGTAMLNYSPAIAEAYYQQIPLIVISADRPMEWIDQDDSQTIIQYGAYNNFIKASYNIPAYYHEDSMKWYINRIINDACQQSKYSTWGPVHINVQLVEPLCNSIERSNTQTRIVNTILPYSMLSNYDLTTLRGIFTHSQKVMILAGFSTPNRELEEFLIKLSLLPNVVVLTETITNLSGGNIIRTIDRVITEVDDEKLESYSPDLLITFGGALVTRMLKEMLRKYKPIHHWHIGLNQHIIDTMMSVNLDIKATPLEFFAQFAINPPTVNSNYRDNWKCLANAAKASHELYLNSIPWCDLKAFDIILESIPLNYNLQLSNGTSIRYAQLFGDKFSCQCNCNRGVAGIDGCTSTALGASLVSTDNMLLITGDMSFSYDLGGLASQYKNSKFKIIVMNNGGGGIFRFLKGPSSLPELEDYFEVHQNLNIKGISSAFDYDYMEISDEKNIKEKLELFFSNKKNTILCITTPREINADILRGYFRRNHKNMIQ